MSEPIIRTPNPGGAIKPIGSGNATIPKAPGVVTREPPPTTPNAATVWSTVNLTAARLVTRLSVMQNTPYVLQNPQYLSAGDERAWTVTHEGATTVSISGTGMKAYKNRTDVTSTIFPSGSASASGNEVTLPTAKAWTSGERYVIEYLATVDGIVTTVVIIVIVRVTGGE